MTILECSILVKVGAHTALYDARFEVNCLLEIELCMFCTIRRFYL